MIFVYDEFDKISEENYQKMYNLLPPSRKEKASIRRGINKKITIFEYFYLKNILNFDGFPDFEYGVDGKPSIHNYHFSISHADNVLCIATHENPVGVDIEKIKNYDEKIAKLVFTQKEINIIKKRKNIDKAFTKMYVKKESALKCLGKSLSQIVNILNENNFKFSFRQYKNYIICECCLLS